MVYMSHELRTTRCLLVVCDVASLKMEKNICKCEKSFIYVIW